MKRLQNTENKLIPIGFSVMLLVVWQIVVDFGAVKRFILPSPTDVVRTLVRILPDIYPHLGVTLYEAFIGFSAAILLGVLLAFLMDSFSLVRNALYPLLVVSQTIPIIALAPLFVIWFGFGLTPKVIVVVLVCFFPIVISLHDGLASIDRDIINLMKSMGASTMQIFRQVKLPAALVSFFSGLRIAATYSIMGAVIGEWLGGSAGLGVYMMRVKHSYSVDKFFAAIVIIVVLSMLLFKGISALQLALMPWSRDVYKEVNNKNSEVS